MAVFDASNLLPADTSAPQQQDTTNAPVTQQPVQPSNAPVDASQDPSFMEKIGHGLMGTFNELGNTVNNAVQPLIPDSVKSGSPQTPFDNPENKTIGNGPPPWQAYNADYEARRKAAGDTGIDWTSTLAGSAPLLFGPQIEGKLGAAGLGAVSGALEPDDSPDYWTQKAQNIATGAGIGLGMGIGSSVISPHVDSAVQYLMDKGISPTIGQISKTADTMLGKVPSWVENSLSRLPLLGDMIKAAKNTTWSDFNKVQYNDALAPIGEKSTQPVGQQGVKEVADKASAAYDGALKNMQFKIDPQYQNDILNLVNSADNLSLAQKETLSRKLAGVNSHIDNNTGLMNGAAVQTVKSELSSFTDQLAKSPASTAYDTELAPFIQKLNDAITDNLRRNNAPGLVDKLDDANATYALYMRIQEAAAKAAKRGSDAFSPSEYMQSVYSKSGKKEMSQGEGINQTAAGAAVKVLGGAVPDSGTTAGRTAANTMRRMGDAATGTAVAGGLYENPSVTAGVLGLGSLASLPYTDIGRRWAANLMTQRPVGAATLAQGLRQTVPAVAPWMLNNNTNGSVQQTNQVLSNPQGQHFADGGLVQPDASDTQTQQAFSLPLHQSNTQLDMSQPNPALQQYPTSQDITAQGFNMYPRVSTGSFSSAPQGVTIGAAGDATPYMNIAGDDMDAFNNVISKLKASPNAKMADQVSRAYLASKSSPVSSLGFDVSKLKVTQNGVKYNLGGETSASPDVMWTSDTAPYGIVHEATHRGLQQLQDAGTLTKDQKAWLNQGNNEEMFVRHTMTQLMGDPENGVGAVSTQQRNDAYNMFTPNAFETKYPEDMGSTKAYDIQMFNSINQKAQELTRDKLNNPIKSGTKGAQ